MAACTLVTTVTSMLFPLMRIPQCTTGVFGASLDVCFDTCWKDKACLSYFHKAVGDRCCLHTTREMEGGLVADTGINYYWLYPDSCHPSTGYTLSRYVDLCYRIYATPVSWTDANTNCVSDGATLVSLTTQKKIDFMKNVVTSDASYSTSSYAIGGIYNSVMSRWEWQTGSEILINDWNSDSPISDTMLSRVVMDTNVGHKWKNVQPSTTGGYICEMPFMSLNPYV